MTMLELKYQNKERAHDIYGRSRYQQSSSDLIVIGTIHTLSCSVRVAIARVYSSMYFKLALILELGTDLPEKGD